MPDRPRTLRRPRPCVPIAGPQRGSAHARGYGKDWDRLRERVLADVSRVTFPLGGPLCVKCRSEANEVDHIRPFRGRYDPLRTEPANLQPLCKPCHSRKTATEDGGFGRAPVTEG